ncbi:hypothetical protein GQ43DRAFT_484820 [Delitschia confertaspora ATCC 74209]|uniref:FAD-binding FR-type domain-containing protein n=1 Tax=Delitschia confertaspora ATCC 74209 TaxID=1513339 RepID=A0A9P4MTZ4_9PLEO|nr:hypothetical protein GQ43DRAFT_484820 [Delitschia confertaspora ATCC 74209]
MSFSFALSFHSGEEKMHQLLRIPHNDNPTSSMLTPQASFILQSAPLMAVGALDADSRPWTSLWGGKPGFSRPLGGGIVGTRTVVDGVHDPVVQALVDGSEKGAVVEGKGKMVSALAIDLINRKRMKVFGRMVAGSLGEVEMEGSGKVQDQLQLVTKIEQSLGNCPKYLNQYVVQSAPIDSRLLSTSANLSPEGVALVAKADMFFLSSSTTSDMDTNHRGGAPGFVRLLSNGISGAQLVYPEYSGNRLYQTLGNLQVNPKVGITFPDFVTGDVLYLTGTAEILVAKDAAALLPGSNLTLKITVQEARFVRDGLPFRGERKDLSPYNPILRLLPSEGNVKAKIPTASPSKTARFVRKTSLTPNIAQFKFEVKDGLKYEPGQWIALDFSHDMDYGYSHMRDDDPRSLNDDFVRTFTISSNPISRNGEELEFEITIRNVGPVTNHLFKQNERDNFSVPILGVGGEFKIEQAGHEGKETAYIAGGVGITPLLGQLLCLDISPSRFKLFWSLRVQDLNFSIVVFKQYPVLAACSTIFLTGTVESGETSVKMIESLLASGVSLERRRMEKIDLDKVEIDRWYICAAKGLRKELMGWLGGQRVQFEGFDY